MYIKKTVYKEQKYSETSEESLPRVMIKNPLKNCRISKEYYLNPHKIGDAESNLFYYTQSSTWIEFDTWNSHL